MEITEVRIKLMEDSGERLRAFCSITFDDSFVVRDLKIIEGTNGLFVAMPSRKLAARCPQCGCKNHLRSAHCNQCGVRLKDDQAVKDENGRAKLYADIAHPINSSCREKIQERIVEAFHAEVERSQQPGYVPSYDDFDQFEETGQDFNAPYDSEAKANSAKSARRESVAEARPTADERMTQPPERIQGPHSRQLDRESKPKDKGAGFGEGILD